MHTMTGKWRFPVATAFLWGVLLWRTGRTVSIYKSDLVL